MKPHTFPVRNFWALRSKLNRGFTTSLDSSVIYQSYSPTCFEFKLHKPKVLNSLDLPMCESVTKKLKEWHSGIDTAPRVALISGTGGKAFCAGGDVVTVAKQGTK